MKIAADTILIDKRAAGSFNFAKKKLSDACAEDSSITLTVEYAAIVSSWIERTTMRDSPSVKAFTILVLSTLATAGLVDNHLMLLSLASDGATIALNSVLSPVLSSS